MKKLAIVLLGMLSMSVMAEGKMYGGVQYAMATYSESGFISGLGSYSTEVNPSALVFTIGNKINKNFAVEARFGMGMGDDTTTLFTVPVALEIDTFFGFYAKGIAPVGKDIDLYGLVGFTDGSVTASTSLSSVTGSDSGMSLGFGVDIATSKTSSINIEYVNYIDGDSFQIDALSIGANYAF